MDSFFNNSELFVGVLYFIVWILLIVYFVIKYKKRNYIFSIFNIGTIGTGIVGSYLLMGPFQYNNKAWFALGISQSYGFIDYLNKNFTINLIGCIVFFIALIIFEFADFIPRKENKIIDIISNSVSSAPILIINIMILIAWYSMIFLTIKSLPIFSNRVFASEYGLQTVYNILNILLGTMALYYLSKYILKKHKLYGILSTLNLMTLFFTGNRGPFIFLSLNMLILYLYMKTYNPRKITKKIIFIIGVVLIIGISMDFIRKGESDVNISNMIENIAYGNTFSDIRDGAFILYGFENNYDKPLYGKNYIADILSFMPKSKFEYRQIWSYGVFTTKTLFGWENHYGLRGGYFLEPYINFGYLGVIVFAIIFAYILSFLESQFYFYIVKNKNNSNLSLKLIILDIINAIASGIMISSGIANTYPQLIILICIIICSVPIVKNKINRGINL